jgi:hypothetical protein
MLALVSICFAGVTAVDQQSCESDPPGKEHAQHFFLYNVGYGERFNFRKSITERVLDTLEVINKHTNYDWYQTLLSILLIR